MTTIDISTIITAVVALLGILFTEIVGWRKVREKIKQLEDMMGVDKTRPSLSTQHDNIHDTISDKHNELKSEISRQIGDVNNNGSLTSQYSNLLKAVNSYKEEKEDRMKSFSKRQKDIQKTINEMSDFFEDWQQSKYELNEANARAEKFRKEAEYWKEKCEMLSQTVDESILYNSSEESDDYELER